MRILLLLLACALAPAAVAAQTTYTIKGEGVSKTIRVNTIQIVQNRGQYKINADGEIIEGRGRVSVESAMPPTAQGSSMENSHRVDIDDDGTVTQTWTSTRTDSDGSSTTTTRTSTTSTGSDGTTTTETTDKTTTTPPK